VAGMGDLTADEVRRLLDLQPMGAENLDFRRFHAGAVDGQGRPSSTAIVCLMDHTSFSDFHRLATDEVWHHYLGGPVRLVLLHDGGRDEDLTLGPDLGAGERPYAVVSAGVWMAARLARGDWAVFGCTMAPGFTDADFQAADRDALLTRWPHRRDDIEAMTRAGLPSDYAGRRD
jgi:predicted cupin superfamily sugar epimerase